MKKFEDIKSKVNNFEINKSWQWMIYIYLVLPVILFVVGFIGQASDIGIYFSKLFHSYGIYVISPIPDFKSLTGYVGIVIPVYLLYKAFKRKDYKDLIISFIMFICVALFFYFEINYILIRYLRFNGGISL